MADEPIYTIFGIDKADDIVDRLTEWTSIGWDETDDTLLEHDISEAAGEIVRLRAVLDAIDALHQPVIDSEWLVKRCEQCDMEWPCRTHLLIQPKERK